MKYFTSLFVIFFILPFDNVGQSPAIDSLKRELSRHTPEDTIRVALLNQLSSEETYNHPIAAGNYALEAKNLAEKINFPEGVALSYRLIGLAFWAQANQSAALANLLRGLKIADSIHSAQIQADLAGNLGMVYNDLGNYHKALAFYRTSLTKQQDLKNVLRQAVMYINIGNGHYHLNQFDSALSYYQKGLRMMRPFKNSRALIDLAMVGVGDAYAGLGNFDEALKFYGRAKASSDSTGHSRGRAHSRFSLANLFIKKKQYARAEKELLACIAIAQAVHLKTYVRDSYELLSKVAALEGNIPQSFNYYKVYRTHFDSIQNSMEASKIASLQLEDELQRKQLEIDGLRKDARLRSEEIKFKNTLLISAVVSFLLIALFLFSTIRSNRKQKALNALLMERNEEITSQQLELSRQRDELLALNEEIRAQQDEVILQRDALTKGNMSIKELNRQITEINQNLEKLVAERTAALQEQNARLEE
ncbi:MAG TPA: tetratricopeptide repeat protein, partial [Cyclobacteriaceae bacterium]|nr:tetratricopeptide repeat protein [Cyclobacteriaceae bacterium]